MDSLLGCSDSLGFVFNHSARWIGLVDARPTLVNTSDQERDSIGSGHWFFLGGRIALSEVEGKIRDGLSECLNSNGLKIGVTMIQCLNSPMLDQGTSIGDDSTCRTANMRVDFEDLLDRLRNDKSRVESTFNGQDNSLSALDSNGR